MGCRSFQVHVAGKRVTGLLVPSVKSALWQQAMGTLAQVSLVSTAPPDASLSSAVWDFPSMKAYVDCCRQRSTPVRSRESEFLIVSAVAQRVCPVE